MVKLRINITFCLIFLVFVCTIILRSEYAFSQDEPINGNVELLQRKNIEYRSMLLFCGCPKDEVARRTEKLAFK
jgi:hypothetical protein